MNEGAQHMVSYLRYADGTVWSHVAPRLVFAHLHRSVLSPPLPSHEDAMRLLLHRVLT